MDLITIGLRIAVRDAALLVFIDDATSALMQLRFVTSRVRTH